MNGKIINSSLYGIMGLDIVKLKRLNLHISELEEKYTIKISFNGYYFKVYNIFGELWFTAPTLEAIEKEMKIFINGSDKMLLGDFIKELKHNSLKIKLLDANTSREKYLFNATLGELKNNIHYQKME